MKDKGKIEIKQVTVYYSLITTPDGISRCAWCKKPVSTFENLDKHLILEEALEKIQKLYTGEELLYKDFEKVKKEILNG